MSDNYKVKRVSEETRMNIQRKSAYTLPNRPTEQGMKPNELKRAFYGFVTEANNSMISEMNRVVDEANKALDEEEKGRTTHENDKNNPHQVTKAQIGLGNADNTKDSEKEVSIPQQVALNNHNLNEAAHQDIRKSIEEEEQSRIKSLDEHNKDTTAHEDIRAAVKKAYDNHTEELAAHNLSDKAHQDIRDEVAKKANTADIQDNLSSTAKNKPLSANQGKVLDGKISSLSSKVTNETLKDVSWDSVNYKLSITKNDGTKVEIDLPMESVVKNGRYDTSTKKIILTLVNNTEISFDASALVNIYQADGTTLVLNGNVFKLSDTILDRLVAVEKEPGCLPVFMDIPFEAPESLTDIAQSYGNKILKTRNTTVGNLCVCRFGTPNSKGQELAIGEITQVVNEDVNGYVDIYVLCIDFLDGENGKIPYVGENGNWWVDGEDTGTKAQGKTGEMALACVSKVTLPENVSMCDMTITLDNFNRTPVAREKFFINGRNAGGSNSYIAIGTIESVTDNGAEVHIEDIVSTKGARGISGTDGVHCEHSWNGTILTITSKSGSSSSDLRGPTGLEALTFNEKLNYGVSPMEGDSHSAEYKYFNRSPIVGDLFQIVGRDDSYNIYTLLCKVTAIGEFVDYVIIDVSFLGKETLICYQDYIASGVNAGYYPGYVYNQELSLPLTSFNRTPSVGESFRALLSGSEGSHMGKCEVTSVDSSAGKVFFSQDEVFSTSPELIVIRITTGSAASPRNCTDVIFTVFAPPTQFAEMTLQQAINWLKAYLAFKNAHTNYFVSTDPFFFPAQGVVSDGSTLYEAIGINGYVGYNWRLGVVAKTALGNYKQILINDSDIVKISLSCSPYHITA